MNTLVSFLYVIFILLLAGSIEGREDTKVYALYFPQFHIDPTNSRLWGENFTDWVRVKKHIGKNRLGKDIPQPTDLGYYDMLEKKTRQKQAELAKEYDVDGFLYYHYYFGEYGPVLHQGILKILEDGEPNLPFAFIWANEGWRASWFGASVPKDSMLIDQSYNLSVTKTHYKFLSQFFHHPNYIKVNGKPLFGIYKFGTHSFEPDNKEVLNYITLLEELAIEDGFEGLHVPVTSLMGKHNIYNPGQEHSENPCTNFVNLYNRLDEFPSYLCKSSIYLAYPDSLKYHLMKVPKRCYMGLHNGKDEPEYLGVTTTFDYSLRREFANSLIWNRDNFLPGSTPAQSFQVDLTRMLMYEKCCQQESVRDKGGQFVFINAWNEWGEGMVIEPSTAYGRSFLESIKNAKAVVKNIKQCDWNAFDEYEKSLKLDNGLELSPKKDSSSSSKNLHKNLTEVIVEMEKEEAEEEAEGSQTSHKKRKHKKHKHLKHKLRKEDDDADTDDDT